MLRSNVEKILRGLHPGVRVVRHSNRGEHIYHGGGDAVYLYNEFVGTIPTGNMYWKAHKEYKSTSGYIHRSLFGILNRFRVKGLLPNKIMEAYRELKTVKTDE